MTTGSAEATERVAGDLVSRLAVGDVVTVSGELGSGKTTFVRGACRALGVTAPVTSPTFTIGHRYPGSVDVSHLDLYRFSGVSPAIVFVEWPEAGADALPPARVVVQLLHAGGDRRRLVLAAEDDALLEGLVSC